MAALDANLWNSELRARIETLQWTVALDVLRAGGTAIIEWGTWARDEREQLRAAAAAVGARTELLHLDVPADTLWARIQQRGAEDPPMKQSDVIAMVEFMHGQAPDENERRAFDAVLQGLTSVRLADVDLEPGIRRERRTGPVAETFHNRVRRAPGATAAPAGRCSGSRAVRRRSRPPRRSRRTTSRASPATYAVGPGEHAHAGVEHVEDQSTSGRQVAPNHLETAHQAIGSVKVEQRVGGDEPGRRQLQPRARVPVGRNSDQLVPGAAPELQDVTALLICAGPVELIDPPARAHSTTTSSSSPTTTTSPEQSSTCSRDTTRSGTPRSSTTTSVVAQLPQSADVLASTASG